MIKTKVSELKHRKKKQKISRIKVSLSRLIPVINLKSRGEKKTMSGMTERPHFIAY